MSTQDITSKDRLDFNGMEDEEIIDVLKGYKIHLSPAEARKIQNEFLGRAPTITELMIWSIENSEHCSYRSSSSWLPLLPRDGPNVIQGPEEDAGIVEIARLEMEDGSVERYGIVIAHESHNHPSQVVPYEGAGTGIGGIVRDVNCMGAKVIAVANPLRFGNLYGKNKNRSKLIVDGVVSGIRDYGNIIGVPNLAGDAYFGDSHDDNCLVNVIALGLVKESDIIHSRAPKEAGDGDYKIVIIGKPTDNSGMGGASFASDPLAAKDKESKKGAVQEPNPFLKKMLFDIHTDVFKEIRKQGLTDYVGFKDMGGGGLVCSSIELANDGGYGADIDLDKVHTSMEDLPSPVIACAETQERYTWVVPKNFVPTLLRIYNEDWDLPNISEGAQATEIGKITVDRNYILRHKGEIVCNAPAELVTKGLKYKRKFEKQDKSYLKEPEFELGDLNNILLKILMSPNVACRVPIYEQYDKEVQGNTVIETGQADAGVLAPLMDEDVPDDLKKIGVALSVDGNPRYGKISPYWQSANAVAEAMRNVAAVGAVPIALTDCCNYGNPEKPEQFWEFVEGIRGVADAAKNIHLKGYDNQPVPVISGNVSFYNESVGVDGEATSIDPSMVIACIGKLDDFSNAITMQLKCPGNDLYLIGERKNELGASEYYQIFDEIGTNIPKPDFDQVKKEIYAVTDAIQSGYVLSCHDISEGGIAVTLAEMCLGGNGEGNIGVVINLDKAGNLRVDKKLFSETGGFIFEANTEYNKEIKRIFDKYGLEPIHIGYTSEKPSFSVYDNKKCVIDLSLSEIRNAWINGLREAMR